MDNLDFLDAPAGVPEPAPVEAEAPPVEQSEGPARAPNGQFASREAQPEPAPEMQPEPEMQAAPEPQAPQVPPGFVPVSALQELRAKVRQLEQGPPPAAPDRYDDPEGWEAHRDQQLNERLLQHTLNTSERFARKDHGSETVEKARDWALEKFQTDPHYYQRIMSDADPYEAVVQDWKREQVLSNMKDGDLDAFLAWKAGQPAPQAPAAPVARVAPAPQPLTPPRSMASAPNAGGAKPGALPTGPSVAFDNVFKE